ncbi:hypothetical protein PNOK_0927900 [Pyrrhoderma noxium]|uniref:Uncharacterized protein n=1 Tax=Pyrrhoderma noxium TaxID=2282107 RepID=A0A286U7G6_9AGAM|nr:hypothetical protein PNOK_0927900 [Pyrrhoderma noxium]
MERYGSQLRKVLTLRVVLSPANPTITFAFLTFPIYSSSYTTYAQIATSNAHSPCRKVILAQGRRKGEK